MHLSICLPFLWLTGRQVDTLNSRGPENAFEHLSTFSNLFFLILIPFSNLGITSFIVRVPHDAKMLKVSTCQPVDPTIGRHILFWNLNFP